MTDTYLKYYINVYELSLFHKKYILEYGSSDINRYNIV